ETAPAAGTTPAPTPAERIAAIKANLVQNATNLRTYQWTETQVVNLKGDDKSNTQKTCYYAADGKVVKTPLAPPAEAKDKPGLRGKIVDNKKEELSAYMKSAVALVKSYVPPDPAKLQAAKDAGKVSMSVLDPGKRARLDIKDYQKPGDNLGIEIDMTTNQILGLNVASYLADAKDAVTLDVKMASLPDGTGYPSTIVLNGAAQKIKVTVSNSGYVKKTS
ncbi:MAG TPA: hypothetical protein VJS69_06885, partial [Candidatus Krumholzibacteria bacterium]|nr:hypothetical protein [Candidatus Krumholzibacteria bacterium]